MCVQNRLADAWAHKGGLGAGGEAALERCQLFHGLSAIRTFFFFSFSFPSSPSQPPNAHQQAGRKSMLKRI